METCKSPRTVLVAAYELAQEVIPEYSSQFSRKEYTQPQLFACLVLREHQKKSYRGIEALLVDCPELLAAIGMNRAPDHNTLCRAFQRLVKVSCINRMLDETAAQAEKLNLIKSEVGPTALDSSMFESRHVSRHYEIRQRQTERKKSRKDRQKEANRRRSVILKRLPKLSLAVSCASHLVLAARATTGAGGDAPFFEPLLREAARRARIAIVVCDAGYDSEDNHCLSREQMGIRSIIPPTAGRPTSKPASTRYRRLMQRRFQRKADKRHYGQRWQVETVNSMIKRNLGAALRARTARRRSMELLLRVITHNVMILANVQG